MRLEANGIAAGYGGKMVLDGVTLTIPDGSIVTLLGPNGSGKSTLLKVMGRLLKPHSGTVTLDGRPVAAYDTGTLARTMAVLPQLHHVSGAITVRELVSFGRFPHRSGFGTLTGHDREVIDEALKLTRLTGLQQRQVATLSGGERQKAWIAMTLAQSPEILLLDEPTTFLDIRSQLEIIELVRMLNRRLGITVLMVLHDLNLAARCSDILVTLKGRRIRHAGSVEAVFTPEILREIFGIEAEIHRGGDGKPYCVPVTAAGESELS